MRDSQDNVNAGVDLSGNKIDNSDKSKILVNDD